MVTYLQFTFTFITFLTYIQLFQFFYYLKSFFSVIFVTWNLLNFVSKYSLICHTFATKVHLEMQYSNIKNFVMYCVKCLQSLKKTNWRKMSIGGVKDYVFSGDHF